MEQPLLKTVEFIRQNGLEMLLKEPYFLQVRRHKELPHLVQLHYSQLNSPFETEIVSECRGVILDEKNDWRVVCLPYTKFFNYTESHAATIDWSTAKIYEKLDGTLMTLYYYDNKWNVASSGLPDASGRVAGRALHTNTGEGLEMTFRDLFWSLWNSLGYTLPDETHMCFMFELVTESNQIIVKNDRNLMALHGVRDMNTLKELDPAQFAEKYGWELARPIEDAEKSLAPLVAKAAALNPVKCEGFVVCDSQYNRIKIKCPQYVVISLLSNSNKTGLNSRRLLEIVQSNEASEFLGYFPQFTEEYTELKDLYDRLCAELQTLYDSEFKHLYAPDPNVDNSSELNNLRRLYSVAVNEYVKANNLSPFVGKFLLQTKIHEDITAVKFVRKMKTKDLDTLLQKFKHKGLAQ